MPKRKSTKIDGPASTDRSVRIEKISNGFVVTESSMSPRGNFRERKTFTPTKPELKIKPSRKRGSK